MVTLATTMAGVTANMYEGENCYQPLTVNPNSFPPPIYPGHPG